MREVKAMEEKARCYHVCSEGKSYKEILNRLYKLKVAQFSIIIRLAHQSSLHCKELHFKCRNQVKECPMELRKRF